MATKSFRSLWEGLYFLLWAYTYYFEYFYFYWLYFQKYEEEYYLAAILAKMSKYGGTIIGRRIIDKALFFMTQPGEFYWLSKEKNCKQIG